MLLYGVKLYLGWFNLLKKFRQSSWFWHDFNCQSQFLSQHSTREWLYHILNRLYSMSSTSDQHEAPPDTIRDSAGHSCFDTLVGIKILESDCRQHSILPLSYWYWGQNEVLDFLLTTWHIIWAYRQPTKLEFWPILIGVCSVFKYSEDSKLVKILSKLDLL